MNASADTRLRIWLMPSAYAPHRGGIETVTARLARELARRDHDVLVITNRYPPSLPDEESIEGTRVVRLAWPVWRRTPSGAARFQQGRRATRRELRALGPPPDLVHVHGVSSQADAALHLHATTGVPIVVTTHGEITADAHTLYSRAHARRDLRAILDAAAAVTVPAARVALDSAGVGLALPSKHLVVPNGIDLPEWRAVPHPAAGGHVALVWGRHSTEKALHRVPRAWSIVRESIPDARLVVAGTDPAEVRLRDEHDHAEGVTWSAAREPDEIRHLLADAQVVVVPSRTEAVGLVALEALAAGRVVVYSADTGMAETIGSFGIATDTADPVALAAAIVAAFRDPPPPEPPASHFRSWSDMTDDYLAIYWRALGR